MSIKHDPQDEQLLATATALINQRSYNEAQILLNDRIAQGLTTDNHAGLLLLGEIAGHLIDLGSEGRNEQAINDGLALLEQHREPLSKLVTRASLDYNLGNAKSALADLHTPDAFTTPGLADHNLLLDAKNHYWKALKAHKDNDHFANQLRTNLGNALRKSGRITEALTAYDDIITHNPAFTMAHFHRALALLILEHHSGTRTAKLLKEAATEYAVTINAPDTAPGVRDVATQMHEHTAKRLTLTGYTAEQIAQEAQATKREAAAHSAYRQFTLQHHLGLSEHSLYCHCNGARRDDLMIATTNTPVTGDNIPRLEHILNRLKAEYATARHLYHQATNDQTTDLHEHEITYAELFEGETLSINTELLRTSFRLCLGLLDKIALGICELYDVADSDEKLYFETFWQPTNKKGKASTRWNTLAAKSSNPSLVALYSQATDLRSDGEWALFKAWRNDLEHRFLLLTQEDTPTDLLKARAGTFATRCVTLQEFTERTLHLLQFTRSAIFNFTFCARHETRSKDDGPSITLTLQHKYHEPEPTPRRQRKSLRRRHPPRAIAPGHDHNAEMFQRHRLPTRAYHARRIGKAERPRAIMLAKRPFLAPNFVSRSQANELQ